LSSRTSLTNAVIFHSLRDAVKPLSEADCHTKTQLKKHIRGARPLEQALEARSALTDDGRAPLEASGLKVQDRLTQISDSLARIEQKSLPPF
jgi:hypothetical protein